MQVEIQRRPRISTLLESLSRYEAVAPTQGDDEEGAEAKPTTASQVKMKIKSPYWFEKKRSLVIALLFVYISVLCKLFFENGVNNR